MQADVRYNKNEPLPKARLCGIYTLQCSLRGKLTCLLWFLSAALSHDSPETAVTVQPDLTSDLKSNDYETVCM